MSRCFRLSAAVAILVLGCAAAAGAQPFSGVVVFGDSLSDSGNLAQVLGLPAGNSATTNPDPVAAEIVATAAGAAYVRQIARLQDAGARYVVVYTLPDLGALPAFAAQPSAAGLSAATGRFNLAVAEGLGALGDGVVPIDVFGLFNELLADPGRYDLTNVAAGACAPPVALACGPAGAGLPAA